MKACGLSWYLFLLVLLLAAGCQNKAVSTVPPGPPPDPEVEIRASLAKLNPEDKRLAEQQKYCPVMPEVRLGQMGPPQKVIVKGETLFVCCKSCVESAKEEPDTTLAQLKEVKAMRAKELQQTAPAASDGEKKKEEKGRRQSPVD